MSILGKLFDTFPAPVIDDHRWAGIFFAAAAFNNVGMSLLDLSVVSTDAL